MRLENEQYEEIKQIVIETFLEYDIRCVPINAFEMALKMEIKIIPYSALSEEKKNAAEKVSEDGFSIDNHGTWTIYYNDNCSNYRRINHTIMHEIGHYALGHIKEGEEEETEAKFFAKYALAPPPLIHNCIKGCICPETIRDVFDISYEAAYYAYDYYKKWLQYGERYYTDYEENMLNLFRVA